MYKKSLSFMLLFIVVYAAFPQVDVIMELNDGTVLNDRVKTLNHKIKSVLTQKKYDYRDIKKIFIPRKEKIDTFYMLNTRTFYNSKGAIRTFCSKIYEIQNLELYHCTFYTKVENLRPLNKTYRQRSEMFIKRKSDPFAYSIAIIDGKGYYMYKKRLRQFFYDCPELHAEIKKYKDEELDTKSIMKYYVTNCSN